MEDSPGSGTRTFNSLNRWGIPLQSPEGHATLYTSQINLIDNVMLFGVDRDLNYNDDDMVFTRIPDHRITLLGDMDSTLHELVMAYLLRNDQRAMTILIAYSNGIIQDERLTQEEPQYQDSQFTENNVIL